MRIRTLALLFFFVALTGAHADPALTPKAYHDSLRTGIDVNWAMWRGEIRAFSDKEVRAFHRVGFDHIRIRFHSDWAKIGMDREAYFRHLDRVVDGVLASGMIPILAYDGRALKLEPTEARVRQAVALWKAVAERYRTRSHRLSFDLMIEPGKRIKRRPEVLNDYYARALREIRKSNPDRIVFLAPPKLARPSSLDRLEIPRSGRGYLMVETHFYAAGPSPSNPKKCWTTGTEAERAIFRRELETALRWQQRHGIYIWIGAIMPGDYNHGDHYPIEAQVRFARFFSCLFRRAHVPFAINADQQFYDFRAKRWRRDRWPVLEAVLHPDCSADGK